MSELLRWTVGVLSIAAMAFFLHWIATAFAPRSQGDPRLGTAGFWVWVALVAIFTHLVLVRYNLLPPFHLPLPEWMKWTLVVGWVLLWIGERLGILEWPSWYRASQEDHEEAWATLVGALAGFALLPTIERTFR